MDKLHSWWNLLDNVTAINGVPITDETEVRRRQNLRKELEERRMNTCRSGAHIRKQRLLYAKQLFALPQTPNKLDQAKKYQKKAEEELADFERISKQLDQAFVRTTAARTAAKKARKQLRTVENEQDTEKTATAQEIKNATEHDVVEAEELFDAISVMSMV